jgi:hypothetical protein
MKKILLTTAMGALATWHHASADIILIRTTANGGPKGYKHVTFSDAKASENHRTYMVHCQDPGICPCPQLPDFMVHDGWTTGVVTQVLDELYDRCLQGQTQGSLQWMYQHPASGKRFVFTAVWNLDDPSNSRLQIDKTELQ